MPSVQWSVYFIGSYLISVMFIFVWKLSKLSFLMKSILYFYFYFLDGDLLRFYLEFFYVLSIELCVLRGMGFLAEFLVLFMFIILREVYH